MRQLMLLLIGGCLLLAAPARADEYEAHVARALELARADRHLDALHAWEAAYAMRQTPRLLYEIARTQQMLGMADEAIASYQRFLAADRGEEPRLRAEADVHLQRLRLLREPQPAQRAVVPQDPDVRYIPVRYEMRRHRGMLAGGITMLSIGYGASFLTGVTLTSIFGSNSRSARDQRMATASGLLIIPIVGPLISAIYLPATGESGAGAYWTLPWMITALPFQVTGLALTIAGAKTKRRVPVLPIFSEKLQITPYSTHDGGGILASGRF